MRVTRRGFLTMGAAVAAGSALTACDVMTDSSAATTTHKVLSTDPIRIGVSLELSGSNAVFGRLQERAVGIALADLNVDGVRVGDVYRRLDAIVLDNHGDAGQATLVARQFAEQGVSAIIGGITAETAFATLAVAEDRRVPYLSLCGADAISIPLTTRKFTYKLAPNASDIATTLARDIRSSGLKRVVVMSGTDTLGSDGLRAMTAALDAAGRTLSDKVTLPSSGKDYSGAAARAVDTHPHAIVVWAGPSNTARAVKELRGVNTTAKIYLPTGGVDDDTLSTDNQPIMQGVRVAYPAVLGGAPFLANGASARATRSFINRYTQQFGSFSGCAPYAADALSLVAAAVRRASSVEPRRLRGALESTPYEGVAGAYGFSPIDHGGMSPDVLAMFVAQRHTWIRL